MEGCKKIYFSIVLSNKRCLEPDRDITCRIGKSRRKTLTSCFVVGSGNLQFHAS